jgi:ABC-type sugar transport system ATPase subunit
VSSAIRFIGQLAKAWQDRAPGCAGDLQKIPVRVQAQEWVGRDLQIVVALDSSPVRLRTQQRLALRIGDQVAIRLNLERAHVFDPQTGCRLRPEF